MAIFGKMLCKIVGHKYTGDTKKYHITVGKLGSVDIEQKLCTRCGHVHTDASLNGNVSYDSLLETCSKTVDSTVHNTIYPNDVQDSITTGTIRTPKTKRVSKADKEAACNA